jgi:hypothetical protein
MLRWLIVIVALALMFSSCSKDLEDNTTLKITAQAMGFYSGCVNGSWDYFSPVDSVSLRDAVVTDLTDDFDGNNNLKIRNDTAQYTLKIISCGFDEWITHRTIVNPCDSSPVPDSLHYELHNLNVHMSCLLYDHIHNSFLSIEAEASDEEDLKDGPSFFQSLFNSDCDCYEPRVKAIHFYNKLKNRVLSRIHRRAISQIKLWQAM